MINSSKGIQEAAEKMGYASSYTVVYRMKRLGIKKPDHWRSRPSGYSPEFKEYFKRVIDTCQSVTEATKKLGYSRPASVRYNMKRFGVKTPDCWYSRQDMLRRPRDAGFRAYFEGVINSSKSAKEVMEKMHYTSPNSVWYQMKKQGVRTPDSWHKHPSARGLEFAPFFKNVVETSKTVGEAVQRLGYANTSMVYYHLRRLGIEAPPRWGLKPGVGGQRRARVPEVILKTDRDRAWVAALHQGEGCLTTHYSKRSDDTALALAVRMTDSAPIFKFCDVCGARRPKKSAPRLDPRKPIWAAAIGGLRAYRVLQAILPDLTGQKLKEANRALEFFAPNGYRNERHSSYDVWPDDEYPLRKRGLWRLAQSLAAKLGNSGKDTRTPEGPSRTSMRMDRTCLRIADVLLAARPEGRSLVEIMDESGASWAAVIHHLRHLEENSLIVKEKVPHDRGGPSLLYEALDSLKELRERGWLPNNGGDSPSGASGTR